ncbi:MAG: protoheme IX farnesyltransferase [Candidatus Muproteobacteria bacterium RBG_16_64_11]|uniref:Protoheme IX farnesyltransferase n=1 Tax=Candidatus Muproteobacteria bacterium RBG_16_64_11 TaxID=1817758 RepID=A0A1F6TCP6_9PROT|nr:MAG: protoheme IX farnesyltransferase [Candidatus Muproteobacteria bacterium RBG_16_64_11]
MSQTARRGRFQALAREYLELGKPRVVLLIVFTAVVGMFLAVPGMVPWPTLLLATLGIGLAASSAASINHVLDQRADAVMARTRARPLPTGQISTRQALLFALVLGVLAMLILVLGVNVLTAVLTFLSLIGYAVIYTVFLKYATPQNIVIGGAAGAAPPVLGWAAVTGGVSGDALLLFLIIFVWTPPHFWALALYRQQEYAKVGIPMLPVTHGSEFTRLHILLYTIALAAVTVMPFATKMSGWFYLLGAGVLNAGFIYHAARLYRRYSDALAKKTFVYSIQYLAWLFALLLIDHYRFYFSEALQSALY